MSHEEPASPAGTYPDARLAAAVHADGGQCADCRPDGCDTADRARKQMLREMGGGVQ